MTFITESFLSEALGSKPMFIGEYDNEYAIIYGDVNTPIYFFVIKDIGPLMTIGGASPMVAKRPGSFSLKLFKNYEKGEGIVTTAESGGRGTIYIRIGKGFKTFPEKSYLRAVINFNYYTLFSPGNKGVIERKE